MKIKKKLMTQHKINECKQMMGNYQYGKHKLYIMNLEKLLE